MCTQTGSSPARATRESLQRPVGSPELPAPSPSSHNAVLRPKSILTGQRLAAKAARSSKGSEVVQRQRCVWFLPKELGQSGTAREEQHPDSPSEPLEAAGPRGAAPATRTCPARGRGGKGCESNTGRKQTQHGEKRNRLIRAAAENPRSPPAPSLSLPPALGRVTPRQAPPGPVPVRGSAERGGAGAGAARSQPVPRDLREKRRGKRTRPRGN